MKKRIMIWIMVAVVALPAMAQTFGEQQMTVGFQSTSVMTGSGSAYSASPVLNSDGTASLNSASSGPRRAKMDGPDVPGVPGSPSTPGAGKEENQFPLGDAAVPMLLMAFVFTGITYIRRKQPMANS